MDSFKIIDNYLQKQLLRLLKVCNNNPYLKRSIYLGYGAIRAHVMAIIHKIKEYYKVHSKNFELYDIDSMLILNDKTNKYDFIIPNISTEIMEMLKEEIIIYFKGIQKYTKPYITATEDIHMFNYHFINCIYQAIYLALCEYGGEMKYSKINNILFSLTNKQFFKQYTITLEDDLDTLISFDRMPKLYKHKYSFDWNNNEYDNISSSDMLFQYIKDELIDREKKKREFNNEVNEKTIDYDNTDTITLDDLKKEIKKTIKSELNKKSNNKKKDKKKK